MAFDSFAANAFASNFMTGFSFVDAIKQRKKNEARLEVRLAEERQARSFVRRRTIERDKQVREDRAFTSEERERSARERGAREKGERLALDSDTTDEELLEVAPFSPAAAAELKRRVGTERFKEAMRGVQTIGQAGGGSAVTQSQRPPTLSEQVTQPSGSVQASPGNAPGLPSMTPQERAEHDAAIGAQPAATESEFGFGRDRGEAGLQEVSEEEQVRFDPEFQRKGFLGKIGDVVGGQIAQTVRAAGDVASVLGPGSIGPASGVAGAVRTKQNLGQEFTGTVLVPADRFTDADEFAALEAEGDNEGIRAASAENVAIFAELKAAGRKASSFTLGRQGAVLSGSDTQRRAAIQQQNSAIDRAEKFLNPTSDSTFDELAEADPRAAAVQYLQDRATLEGVRPDLMRRMDNRMVPVLNAVEADLINNISSVDTNSSEGRQQQRVLSTLQSSRDTIARSGPSVSQQAGINSQGLKVGDQTRIEQVTDTIFDPGRPVVTQHTPGAVNAAVAVTSRITPNRRLNEVQIQGLATLAEMGYINKPTALSVMMTGAWPPGQNPNGIKSIQEAGDNVYGITNGGGLIVLQRGKNKNDDAIPNREFGQEQFDLIEQGIRSSLPNITDENVGSLHGMIMQDPGWFRSRFNTTSQEDMRRIGLIMSQSLILSGKKFTELEDGWFTNTKLAPSTRAVMMNETMRDALANEFDVEFIPTPAIKDTTGIDVEGIRQNARDGRYGLTFKANEDQYDDLQVANAFARYETMRLESEAADREQ